MANGPLSGKKVAIVIESLYIPIEIDTYERLFAEAGAQVDLVSRLWGNQHLDFSGYVEDDAPAQTKRVSIDFADVDVHEYAAIIMAANYTSVRLRWLADDDLGGAPPRGADARKAPAVRFFYEAMLNPRIVKAFPCHGLWILTPIPETLAGRRVTCNRVMLADVHNAGAEIVYSPEEVVVDGDVITSPAASEEKHAIGLVNAIIAQAAAIEEGEVQPSVSAATTPSANVSSDPVVRKPNKRRVLALLSEWGYWGEELIGPVEEFDRHGYTTSFCTPTGKRPNAITVSADPYYIDPPLGRSVTSYAMAEKVTAFDDPTTEQGKRLEHPIDLSAWFSARPYWADAQFVRAMEIYNERLEIAARKVRDYDCLLIVGGSGPIVDLVNNQRVHDLILAFLAQDKPIAAECYGVACLAFARNIETRRSIIWGKRVTGHCLEYDYKDGTGFMKSRGQFLDFNMGPPPYPLEYILRDATGPDGAYIGNFGHPTSVIVDYPFITGRSTPDSYLTGRKVIEVLDGTPPLRRWGW